VVIEVLKKEKRFLDVADAQMIQFALGQDKDIWYLIAGKRLFKQIMSEPDAMAAYFSPSEGALSFLKSYSFDLAQVQMQNISEEAQELFKDTMLEGMSNEQAAKYLNSKIKNLTNLRARAIARTESTRAFNLGTLYESQSSAIVKGYRYNAVLDNLTTDICKARNGKFIPKTELTMLANNTPPLHVNCRSRLETVLDDEKEGEWLPLNAPESKQRPADIQAVMNFLRR
jgi:SPP1 gp7 family putative phage head morphogenesis protein